MSYEEYLSNIQNSLADMDRKLEDIWEMVDGTKQGDPEFKTEVEGIQLSRDTLESRLRDLLKNADTWEEYREDTDMAFQEYETSLNTLINREGI